MRKFTRILSLVLAFLLCIPLGACTAKSRLAKFVDFVVEVDAGKTPVVLHLTDPQIMEPESNIEERCYSYIRETVQATKPDLILVTGDLTYGKFDDENGTVFSGYVSFMESFQIPWAPVFGNHDNECPKGVDWQCQLLEEAKYCLFEQKDLTGNGNYSVGVLQGNKVLRAFYMLDSNGCGDYSEASGNGKNGIRISAGLGEDQYAWYENSMQTLKKNYPDVKISMAYHIQTYDFRRIYDELYKAENGEAADVIGLMNGGMKGPWYASHKHDDLKALGVDSIFVGHEHCNNASALCDGIRYQYGQKSSTYDRYNALTPSGEIVGGYSHEEGSTPLIGGTAFSLSQEDGSIVNPYIYYCGAPFDI